MRITVTPTFSDPSKFQTTPTINNPLVPGGK
jgi:hypothetical protein